MFSSNITKNDDLISEYMLLKGKGQYSTLKTLVGFDFDGTQKTLWLEEEKMHQTSHYSNGLDRINCPQTRSKLQEV